MSDERPILVTGGVGYVGAVVAQRLRKLGKPVRVLDALIHGQDAVARQLDDLGVELVNGDIRDSTARETALRDARSVVHLAAIVGDPACALEPELAAQVNVEASIALVADAERAGAERFVYASTCSNYGRISDPSLPIDETGILNPVSLYAEQKVEVERALLGTSRPLPAVTCLRFATVYGVAPRMRFDLTVNEFVRDLWSGRRLEVFGEQFWRPYVHVVDAARAIEQVLEAPLASVAGTVFNVGNTDENFTKQQIVEEVQRQLGGGGRVVYVHRDEDPRDYKVSFQRIADVLGFQPLTTVSGGVAEVLSALEAEKFGDPYDVRYRNTPSAT